MMQSSPRRRRDVKRQKQRKKDEKDEEKGMETCDLDRDR